ncbi:heme A synthase [uncultured Thermosynechococcus sp.]|uniref:COX15/CtaA family protein n=1 Tax=uncultured Thermosynechococcus sp. TaxID=436945 RepID=UPI00260D8BAF|nr:COX15/CtaA family protein [uncultured Thermosynechococcus sp.]
MLGPFDVPPLTLGSDPSVRRQWIFRLVLLMTVFTLFLMAVGSATRVMDAGLACPDWPLCFGTLVPQMDLQIFLEWFHRLLATSLGLLAIAFAGLSVAWRQALSPWVPYAAGAALCLVIVQGILGGLTVTELLRFEIVTAHLGTGLLFFCLLTAITVGLAPFSGTGSARWLRIVVQIAAICVYGQSLLGGLVSSQWAVHQCLYGDRLCGVLNSHLIGVVPATLSVLSVVIVAWRSPALAPLLRQLSFLLLPLVGLQVALGWSTLQLKLQVPALTVAHQVIGATLLGLLVAISALAWRDCLQQALRSPTRFPEA